MEKGEVEKYLNKEDYVIQIWTLGIHMYVSVRLSYLLGVVWHMTTAFF
jgi:hypothetical protein